VHVVQSSEMTSLAAAIRDLEVNTAALQLPSSDLQAESCQSLQCSSGYGTMTNVSAGGSVETMCTSSGGELIVYKSCLLSLCCHLLHCVIILMHCVIVLRSCKEYKCCSDTTSQQVKHSLM